MRELSGEWATSELQRSLNAVHPSGAWKIAVRRQEKDWSALLPPPKALGLMATVWEAVRHDYFRAAEKDAFCLDLSAQTTSGVERMTPQLKPAPPPRDAVATQHRG